MPECRPAGLRHDRLRPGDLDVALRVRVRVRLADDVTFARTYSSFPVSVYAGFASVDSATTLPISGE